MKFPEIIQVQMYVDSCLLLHNFAVFTRGLLLTFVCGSRFSKFMLHNNEVYASQVAGQTR
jgi:hypothetical protein